MTPSEVQDVIDSLQEHGTLPARLTQGTKDAIANSLSRYFADASEAKVQQMTDKVRDVAEAALKTSQEERGQGKTATMGGSPAAARTMLTDFVESVTGANVAETMGMDFFVRVAREVASGAAQYLAQNFDDTRVQEFPALELVRVYDRDVPRGSEKDPEGEENGWDTDGGRWESAAEDSGDDDALAVFQDSGRMVALKSSGVWQALGDGAGGYDDTLGNPFPPFAFNSGFATDEVSREDAVALGLMEDGEDVEPAKMDFSSLLSLT